LQSSLGRSGPEKRPDRVEIAKNWLPRYTGMPVEQFGDYILLTNFRTYLQAFAEQFNCKISGDKTPMQAATNSDGLTMINFGIGSPTSPRSWTY